MTFDEMILRPVRPVVAAWLARLADRVDDLREQARLGVIEVVGRTTAEAVEWLLQSALGVAQRCDPADAYAADSSTMTLPGALTRGFPRPPHLAWRGGGGRCWWRLCTRSEAGSRTGHRRSCPSSPGPDWCRRCRPRLIDASRTTAPVA